MSESVFNVIHRVAELWGPGTLVKPNTSRHSKLKTHLNADEMTGPTDIIKVFK